MHAHRVVSHRLGNRVPFLARHVAPVKPVGRRALVVSNAVSYEGTVRPYTLRRNDTLESIAQKRDISVDILMKLNPDVTPERLQEGSTILLPAEKLSQRDREILEGIGSEYRFYPLRKGETVEEVMQKRNIEESELLALNPGINLKDNTDGKLLKLPADKFTVREREMLIGTGILPHEFFEKANNPFVIGISALLVVCGFVLAWMKFHKDEDMEPPSPGKNKASA